MADGEGKGKSRRPRRPNGAARGKVGRRTRKKSKSSARRGTDRAILLVLGILIGALAGVLIAPLFRSGPMVDIDRPQVSSSTSRQKAETTRNQESETDSLISVPATSSVSRTAPVRPPPIAQPAQVAVVRTVQRTAESPFAGAAAWRRNAVAVALEPRSPAIAVVIDDLGLDRRRSARAVALKGPMTMAFLPYAQNLAEQTAHAREGGHELLVHMPGEALDPNADPGPIALRSGMSKAELTNELVAAFQSFEGYVGLSNHMGSRFTADAAGMTVLMEILRAHGLLFLDSMTSAASLGPRLATAYGVPNVRRDVFLDHIDEPAAIRARLAEVESIAIRRGYAVAIGHPRDHTLAVLEEWLANIEARGFQLAPISSVVGMRGSEG